MSRIGKKPVEIPENVTVELTETGVVARGPHGQISISLPPGLKAGLVDGRILITLERSTDSATQGKIRSEIANAVEGVVRGFSKTLEIVGTGYRASTDGQTLTLNLGFSHPVIFNAKPGIAFQVSGNKITISGMEKVLVGQIASNIRKIRPAEPYKGKGLRYEGEAVRKKQGKTAKGIGGAS